MTRQPNIVIVGGGVIGLSIAYALARAGAAVTVLDAGHRGQASWAAAGMLAPLAESHLTGPLVSLAVESLCRWPAFAARLRAETGTGPELFGPGMLRVARTVDEFEALRVAQEWQSSLGLPLGLMDVAEIRALEPALDGGIVGALLSPREQSVEPRLLLAALLSACRRYGVTFFGNTPVTQWVMSGGRVTAVQSAGQTVLGDQFVVAGGTWSESLGQSFGVRFSLSPLRGQLLSLRPSTPSPLQHIVYTHGSYLVPRPDGTLVAGATEEQASFEPETTAAGIAALRRNASALVPALSQATMLSVWAGLRPMSADGLPLLGAVPGWDNVHIAAGHGRNGILLTPLTADLLAGHLLRGEPIPAPFSPARFGKMHSGEIL